MRGGERRERGREVERGREDGERGGREDGERGGREEGEGGERRERGRERLRGGERRERERERLRGPGRERREKEREGLTLVGGTITTNEVQFLLFHDYNNKTKTITLTTLFYFLNFNIIGYHVVIM